ncbi:hypothetical protein [Caldimonas sp. KR1-144]|uniref:hypothetical protein n=1 Tax=Caldimonas sp. KR1-144 TaxID=3400911 RepID=UPI003C0E71FC
MDATPRRPASLAGDEAARAPGPLAGALAGLAEQLLGQLSDRVVLLQLELRRSGAVMVVIAALAVAGTILVASAWMTLCAAAAGLLLLAGASWIVAVVGVIAVNVVLAALCLGWALRLLSSVGIPLTLRHLTRHAAAGDDAQARRSDPAQAGWAP